MPIIQIFRKDRKFWSESQIEQVQLFFMLHPFYSKFYEHEDFQKVINFTFYTHLNQNQQSRLEINKKSQMLILLSGQIKIYRKILETENKKKLRKKQSDIIYDEYILLGEYKDQYQIIELRNDVIVKSKPSNISQFLFVPTMLYEAHNFVVNNRKLERFIEVLSSIFQDVNRRDLKILAESGCIFKDYKMNGYIYRAGTIPQNCYILVNGNVKIEAPGFSAKKMLDMSIIGQKTIFGDKDLNQESRTHNTICCSSHCKVLIIKKQPYNKFILKNRHINPSYAEKLKSIVHEKEKRHAMSNLEKYQQKHLLPRIMRFHSYAKPEEQQKIQKGLLQNCHILINLSPQKRSNSSFRLPQSTQKDYSINQFDRKLSLFKKIKSQRPKDNTLRLF